MFGVGGWVLEPGNGGDESGRFGRSVQKVNAAQASGPAHAGSAAADEGHLRGHDRQEEDVGVQRQARHVHDGALHLDELISCHIALDEINDGFAALKRGDVVRAVVTFDG